MTDKELIDYVNEQIKNSSETITNTHDLLNEIENIISYTDDLELVSSTRITKNEYLVTAKIPSRHLTWTFQVVVRDSDDGNIDFYLARQ